MRAPLSAQQKTKVILTNRAVFRAIDDYLSDEDQKWELALTLFVKAIAEIIGQLPAEEEELLEVLALINKELRHMTIEAREKHNKGV